MDNQEFNYVVGYLNDAYNKASHKIALAKGVVVERIHTELEKKFGIDALEEELEVLYIKVTALEKAIYERERAVYKEQTDAVNVDKSMKELNGLSDKIGHQLSSIKEKLVLSRLSVLPSELTREVKIYLDNLEVLVSKAEDLK